ncbi:Hypothetical_protein [Hexamita inflata]|uniref:Hypothetical_protein n=1 Tax=Hexamita inflata TaxID=28002 RepID=A0ABP1I008_9EUKA
MKPKHESVAYLYQMFKIVQESISAKQYEDKLTAQFGEYDRTQFFTPEIAIAQPSNNFYLCQDFFTFNKVTPLITQRINLKREYELQQFKQPENKSIHCVPFTDDQLRSDSTVINAECTFERGKVEQLVGNWKIMFEKVEV